MFMRKVTLVRVRRDEHLIVLSPQPLDLPSRRGRLLRSRIEGVLFAIIAIVVASAAATIALIVLASVIALLRHAL